MRKLLLFCSIICLSFCMMSCASESKNEEEEIVVEEATRYYVKYVVSTYYIQAEGVMINDKGEQIAFSGNGEYVFGPVKKGFKAYMKINNANKKTAGQILVSINQEPFTLKVSRQSYDENIELSYTIE